MKVAFVSFNYGEYCIRLASALAQEAEVLLLLSRAHAQPHLRLLDKVVAVEIFDKPRLRQIPSQGQTIKRLVERIRQFNPDVIHLQQGYIWFNMALPLLDTFPLVITAHDPKYHAGDTGVDRYFQPITNWGFRRAHQLIVHAEKCKQELIEALTIPADRIHVIGPPLMGDSTFATDIAEEEGNILFFGRIWPYKGLEYLIRAEPLITAHYPQAKIVIAGEGENFERYRRMMVHPERFAVTNTFIPDEKAAEFFRRASVVVLPYVDASQSGVIPMAYTYGKPVVATTVGGLPELIDDGLTGYLVSPRDELALAQAVLRLLDDPAWRKTMGLNAKKKIETKFSPQEIARQTLSVYALTARSVRLPFAVREGDPSSG